MPNYTATAKGNWNEASTWGGQQLPSPVSGEVTITIPKGVDVAIPSDYSVEFDNALLQIIGGGLIVDGTFNVTRNVYNNQEHSVGDNGRLVVSEGGTLSLTVQGDQRYPLTGLAVSQGTIENRGRIDISCKTIANAFGTHLAYGIIIDDATFTNDGIINVTSPDSIPNGGYGPSFCLLNRSGTLINNADASIIATSTPDGAAGGGIIKNNSGANFQNHGLVQLAQGQFANQGNFSGVVIGKGTVEAASASAWSGDVGPMSGNSQVLVVFNNNNAWYSEASSGNPGLVFKKGGGVRGKDIASAGYESSSFVAVGHSVNQHNQVVIDKSINGIDWDLAHAFTVGEEVKLNAVIAGNNDFVAVGYSGSNGKYAIDNGTKWSTGAIEGVELKDIAYGNISANNTPSYKYLGVSAKKTYLSSDGMVWAEKSILSYESICYSKKHGFFFGVIKNVGEIYRTGSGTQWTKMGSVRNASNERSFINDFIWSEEAQMFIAVGGIDGERNSHNALPSAVFISSDGITWSQNLYDQGSELLSVSYGAGLFVAAGYNDTIIRIYV